MRSSLLILALVYFSLNASVGSIQENSELTKSAESLPAEEDVTIVVTEKDDIHGNIKIKRDYNDRELTYAELTKLKDDEKELRKTMKSISQEFGHMTFEMASVLHFLGKNLYQQKKYPEVMTLATKVVKIHEKLDGVEHINTADALGNLGSAAFSVHDQETCVYAMRRALYIILKVHGEHSKEALMHRGRMLSFDVPHSKVDRGLSYEEYLDEL